MNNKIRNPINMILSLKKVKTIIFLLTCLIFLNFSTVVSFVNAREITLPDVFISGLRVTSPDELIIKAKVPEELAAEFSKHRQAGEESSPTELSSTDNNIIGQFSIINNDHQWNGNLYYEVSLLCLTKDSNPIYSQKSEKMIISVKNEKPVVLMDNEPNDIIFNLEYPKNGPNGEYFLEASLFRGDGIFLNSQRIPLNLNLVGKYIESISAETRNAGNNEKTVYDPGEEVNLFIATFNSNAIGQNGYFKISVSDFTRFGEKIKEFWSNQILIAPGTDQNSISLGTFTAPNRYMVSVQLYAPDKKTRISPQIYLGFMVNGSFARITDVFSLAPRKIMFKKAASPDKIKIGVSAFSLPEQSKGTISVVLFDEQRKVIAQTEKVIKLYALMSDSPVYEFEFKPAKTTRPYYAEAKLKINGLTISQKEFYYYQILNQVSGKSVLPAANTKKTWAATKDMIFKKYAWVFVALALSIGLLLFLIISILFHRFKNKNNQNG